MTGNDERLIKLPKGLFQIDRPDQTWRVRLIEDDFKQRMFGVEDV